MNEQVGEGAVIQMGYVVDSLDDTINDWVSRLGIGPWFILPNFSGLKPLYLGKECLAKNDLAFAYSNGMQYELIMPLDEHASVWNQTRPKAGSAFHHFGVATTNVPGRGAALTSKGCRLVYTDELRGGGQVAYLNAGDFLPGMIELLPFDDGFRTMFDLVREASLNWNGDDPIRHMPA